MSSFGRQVVASIIGSFVGIFLATTAMTMMTLGLVMVVMAVSSVADMDGSEIKEGSVFVLNLAGEIVEETDRSDDFFESLFFGPDERRVSLRGVLKAIDLAAENPNVKSLYVKLRTFQGGLAMAQTIRNKLMEFKESGKPIVAYTDGMGLKEYYILSTANHLSIHPAASFSIKGLAAVPTFFKNTFSELGLQPQAFRVGRYKSAIEPFTEERMSDDFRNQLETLLGDVWEQLKSGILEARPQIGEQIESVPSEKVVLTAQEAVEMGFFDQAQSSDDLVYRLWDTDDPKERHTVGALTLLMNEEEESFFASEKDQVAIIVAEGAIRLGTSSEDEIGSDTIVRKARAAFEDKKVKAVVLRVNSGGGSALASDIMWRQFVQSQERHKKPFMASFSDAAASGGYYMAASADKVFAEPLSITGSIGVFGLLFNTQELVEGHLKLGFDKVMTHRYGDFSSSLRPLNDFEKRTIQTQIEQIYDRFLEVVRTKRPFETREDVHVVAQGQVYTGLQAKELGLIDELGDLQSAVLEAAASAGLSDYEVKIYKSELTPFEKLKESLGASKTALMEAFGSYLSSAPLMHLPSAPWMDLPSAKSIRWAEFLVRNQGAMALSPVLAIE